MSKVLLSLIAAVSDNGVIGDKGKLPWSFPDDLKHFHDLTIGHAVIMGRKTYESIPEKHRPLSGRLNIILTHQDNDIPGGMVVHSIEEAIQKIKNEKLKMKNDEEIFVIGGAEVYRQALPLARRMYITRVHATVEGDVLFPIVVWGEWREVSREEHPPDTRHAYPFTFLMYEKKAPHPYHFLRGEGSPTFRGTR